MMDTIYSALRIRGRSQPSTSTPSSTARQPRESLRSAGPSSSHQASATRRHTASSSSAHPTSNAFAARPAQRKRESVPRRPPDGGIALSEHSTPTVRNSYWFCSDFMTGAGMVVLQPATGKVLLLYDPRGNGWFLPKGRKDVGESLEQTALREAYEEVRRCVVVAR